MSSIRTRVVGVLPATVGVVAGAMLVVGVVVPTQAAEPSNTDVAAGSWKVPDESVNQAPSELAASVTGNDKARVVALREENGAPAFDVTPVKGKAQAEAVVAQKQASDETLAVSVEEKQKLISATDATALATNDPYWGSQWALGKLQADSAWQVAQGSGQTVAVVDTGTSAEPDLAPQLLTGWDFITGRANGRTDENGHGTHVAGIIAATANNSLGGSGLAPQTKILPVRVLDSSGRGYWSDIANGIVYAVNQGAGVINLSLGSHTDDSNLQAAINYATSKGRVVVAAVGNDSNTSLTYPAAYPGVIGVAASDQSDAIASFSNRSSAVDVAAPGVGILSTVPGGYASLSGTSMAAPFVSATAALIRSAAVSRGLGAVNVEQALRATAVDIGAPGVDTSSGAGRIDPRNAMCAVGACAVGPVGLRPTVTLKKKKLTVNLNRALVQRVVLQRKVGKVWQQIKVKSTSSAGTAVFTVKKGVKYRVVVPGTARTFAITTRTVQIH